MGHRPGILAELLRTDQVDILDTFYAGRPLGRAELLFTKYRKSFLETQLEPITQGYPVARPVVEVFVADDITHRAVIMVCRCRRQRQYVFGVENVKPFVFHCPHIEVFDGDDVVLVEVILTAIGFFVPVHGIAQGSHRVAALGQVAFAGIDP